MAAWPIRNQRLDPLHRGDEFSQPINLTIPAGIEIPDPNTWTNARFSIVPKSSSAVVVQLADMTVIITGTGPWSVSILAPLTKSQTLGLPVGMAKFQLDFEASNGNQVVLVDGLIEVLAPDYALPA